MLEEIHENSPVKLNDSDAYTLARIEKRDVL
jgi:hypothetical protein